MQTVKEVLKKPTRQRNEEEVSRLIQSKSLRALADVVPADEQVHYVARGMHNGSLGVIAATDKRVIFVSKKLVGKVLIDFEYQDVLAAVAASKIFTSTILIKHDTDTFIISLVSRRYGKRIARFIDDACNEAREAYMKGVKK